VVDASEGAFSSSLVKVVITSVDSSHKGLVSGSDEVVVAQSQVAFSAN
jgi:hypothetical protein